MTIERYQAVASQGGARTKSGLHVTSTSNSPSLIRVALWRAILRGSFNVLSSCYGLHPLETFGRTLLYFEYVVYVNLLTAFEILII